MQNKYLASITEHATFFVSFSFLKRSLEIHIQYFYFLVSLSLLFEKVKLAISCNTFFMKKNSLGRRKKNQYL